MRKSVAILILAGGLAGLSGAAQAEEPVRTGLASWYGARFQGATTASGEPFDMSALTAAHRSLPFGTRVRVTEPRSGRSVVVRINDRGPFAEDRIIDLSRAAARELGLVKRGVGKVRIEVLGGA